MYEVTRAIPKRIRARCRVPCERFGIWMRSARVNSAGVLACHSARMMAWQVVAGIAVVLFPGCAGNPSLPRLGSQAGGDNTQLYQAALMDAATPEKREIYHGLLALDASTPGLEWGDPSPDAPVKMVTVMSEAAFLRHHAGRQPERLAPPEWGRIWVTVVPELRDFCRALPGDAGAKALRVKQWLGLRPEGEYNRVVEIWVRPSDLARPCPDPEVTDTSCTLDENGAAVLDPDYSAWYKRNSESTYSAAGHPWTRLGYTYDWSPPSDTSNPNRPVGASEYLVRPNAKFKVVGSQTLAGYCAR